MPAPKTLKALAIAFMATLPLAGCQSNQLTECTKKNSFLEHRITEYKQRTEVLETDFQLRTKEIDNLRAKLAEVEAKLVTLEKDNAELQNKLAQRLEGTKGMIVGVEELRRMQQEAAEKLRRQEAEKAAESTPSAPPLK
jgi:septal ring factor EnvC (AmiA/AmiB activator)